MEQPLSRGRTGGNPSTLGNWVQAILRTLDAQGLNSTAIAEQAGLSPRALRRPSERVPQAVVTNLWKLAVEATGDPAFGLHVPRYSTVSTFGAFAYAVFASSTLESAFLRLVRYQRVISNAVELHLEPSEHQFAFAIDVLSVDGPPFEAIDAFFALLTRLARGLTGNALNIEPKRVCFIRPEPKQSDFYHRMFRAPVEFGARRNLLVYARPDFELPLPDANAAVASLNDDIVTRQLALLDQSDMVSRVYAAVVEALADGPTEQLVARRLGMSTSSLQAALARRGTTYKSVLNEARDSLARTYLQSQRYSAKEVAFLLGFSDAASFTRAFRRWTGESPRDFTRRGTSLPGPAMESPDTSRTVDPRRKREGSTPT